MDMKLKPESAGRPAETLEIFVPAASNGNGAAMNSQRAIEKFHARLSSPEFAEQMTGIFFDAKRAALAASK